MHHYGGRIRTSVKPNKFTIEIENQESGAVITVTGPARGVFENPQRLIDEDSVRELADAFAKTLRDETGEMTMGAGA